MTEVNAESVTESEAYTRILELCKLAPKGITDIDITKAEPEMIPQKRVEAINKLLSMGHIDILRGSKGSLMYRIKDTESKSKVKGGDNRENLVYQIIEEAGNKGIWIRDIRYKCNLLLTQVNKILKSLDSKKLIKAVNSVAASKKKVYMLYNVEPDRSVTGGAWYSDQDFESEFVDVLNQQCLKFLQQKREAAKQSQKNPIAQQNSSYSSSKDVWKFITELGISKIQLTVEDIETILETLIYDAKVERTIVATAGTSGSGDASVSHGQTKLYRAINPVVETTGLMKMPCGVCKVFDQCYEGGVISPTNCVYMKEWLDY